MNVVEMLCGGVCPFTLDIVDIEFAIGWNLFGCQQVTGSIVRDIPLPIRAELQISRSQ